MGKWVEVGSEFPVTCLGKKFYGMVTAISENEVELRLAMPVVDNRS